MRCANWARGVESETKTYTNEQMDFYAGLKREVVEIPASKPDIILLVIESLSSINSMKVSGKTRTNAQRYGVLEGEEESLCRIEFDSMKKQWTDWFLKIRPDAELLD